MHCIKQFLVISFDLCSHNDCVALSFPEALHLVQSYDDLLGFLKCYVQYLPP